VRDPTHSHVIAPSHELLLGAILFDGRKAIDAWERWREGVGRERIDYPSQRLIPMLYAKLAALGVEHPDMLWYKGVYRHTWSTNHALLHAALPLLRELRANGVRTMLLKGIALVVHYHRDYGLRPMADLDLLVRAADRVAAAKVLAGAGWRGEIVSPHAQNFVKDGRECDLHWHLLLECCAPEDDDDLWRAATTAAIRGVEVDVIDPADMLLHLCAHGIRGDPTAPIRWIVDAMTVLRSEGGVDWTRLSEQTRKRRLVLPMRMALGLLAHRFGAPVPEEVLEGLERAPVSLRERLDFHARSRPTGQRGPASALWVCVSDFRQMAASDGKRPGPIAFLRYLRTRWKIAPRQLPARMLREVWQRR